MGDYITQSDIEEAISHDRLRKLTDDENAKSIDFAVVNSNIESAEGIVNGYVGKQYTVPITGTIPAPVKTWALDITVYRIYNRRPPPPENIADDYRATMKQLQDVAKGDIDLGIGDSGATEAPGYEPEFDYEDRQFNRTGFEGW